MRVLTLVSFHLLAMFKKLWRVKMFQVLLLRTVLLMNVSTMALVTMLQTPLRCVPMFVYIMGNV
jgi:hypothetical protein